MSAARRSLPTRHGFLWRAKYETDYAHPMGYQGAGYFKFVRAWTKIGALRLAESMRHQRWFVTVERWS